MTKRHYIVLLIPLLLSAALARADTVVIVSASSDVAVMSKREVIDLFMGRYVVFPNGKAAQLLDQAHESKARQKFYKTLTGKNSAQINAYWARLIFTGRAHPPKEVMSDQAIIDLVSDSPNAIGYVDEKTINKNVKVVLKLH
ncbi:MAG: hypothetical protein JKY93_06970 [Gammaproteobacteria bacterium]|nr:hypothetical protein [Gammaproteobacteria bacterium]